GRTPRDQCARSHRSPRRVTNGVRGCGVLIPCRRRRGRKRRGTRLFRTLAKKTGILMADDVILFAGPMGAGKTTAIRSVSEIPVVSTEAENNERNISDKPTTTVALDYGEILLSDDEKVRLYGLPGQKRFDFMWRILVERAMGMVLL